MAAYSDLDEAFRPLADPSRRRLLDSLNERNGQTLRELGSMLDMARQSVSKHLAVLKAANLVTGLEPGGITGSLGDTLPDLERNSPATLGLTQ